VSIEAMIILVGLGLFKLLDKFFSGWDCCSLTALW